MLFRTYTKTAARHGCLAGRTPSRGWASARYGNCAVAGWAAGGQRKDAEETLCANEHRNGAAHSAGHVHRHSTHSHGAGRGLQRLPPFGASNGLVLARPVSCGMCASRSRLGGRYNRFARSCQAIGAGGGRAAGRTRLCGNARRVARWQAAAVERRRLDGRGGRGAAVVEGEWLPDGRSGRGAVVVELPSSA